MAEQLQWLVNGTRLEDLDQTERIEAKSNILYFIDIPVGTTIQCIIDFTSGESVLSNNAVQGEEKIVVATIICKLCIGLLPAVDSLTAISIPLDSIISLTWTPPFSLDLPGVDPDITGYCVNVVNSTSSLVIDSQCGITNTQYNYTVSPNGIVCDTYTFAVTPVNIVGNGTSANVTRGILQSGKCFD